MNSTLLSSAPAGQRREVVYTLGPDAVGVTHGPTVDFRPLAEDVPSFLTGQAASLTISLRDGEIASNIATIMTNGFLAAPMLRYSTAAQNFATLRAVFQLATQLQAVMIGDFLNTLTDAQLQAAFGMTLVQVQTLRANKLQPAASVAANIRANTGQ